MPLVAFEVAQFQSYYDTQTLELDEGITFIAGRNDVGKSALLRAMRVLAEPQEGGRNGFRVRYEWRLPSETIWNAFASAFNEAGEAAKWRRHFLVHKELTLDVAFGLRLDKNRAAGVSADVVDDVEVRIPELPQHAEGSAGRASGWRDGPFAGSSLGVDQLAGLARHLGAGIRYIGPRAIDVDRRTVMPSGELDPRARNLTDVMVYLRNSEPALARELTDFMRMAFPQIEDVVVPPAPEPGGYAGEPTVYYGGTRDRRIPLRHCGTGIAQMAALAVAVMTARPGSVLLIDEPQADLHPHAERMLFELLGRHPEHQYVIATHSHATLSQASVGQTRLVVMKDGESRLLTVAENSEILDELEVSPADLWLVDSLVWVEGPSDAAIVERVLHATQPAAKRISTAVRELPDASAASSGKKRTIERTYRLVTALAQAVLPIPVRMLFLFDADEKTEEDRQRIIDASRGCAKFLDMREIENLFLGSPELIAAALRERCGDKAVDVSEVEKRVAEMLNDTDDKRLFPQGLGQVEPRLRVKASEVIDRLFWDLTCSRYDKVADGRTLVDIALRDDPACLQPLGALLEASLADASAR